MFSAPRIIIESFSPTSASSVILNVSENCATSIAYFATVLFCAKAPVDKNTMKKPSRTKAKRYLRILNNWQLDFLEFRRADPDFFQFSSYPLVFFLIQVFFPALQAFFNPYRADHNLVEENPFRPGNFCAAIALDAFHPLMPLYIFFSHSFEG